MLIFSLRLKTLALFVLLQESENGFEDLGLLLLIGVAAALVVAVGFTLIRFKLRDKKPPSSNFISISSEND